MRMPHRFCPALLAAASLLHATAAAQAQSPPPTVRANANLNAYANVEGAGKPRADANVRADPQGQARSDANVEATLADARLHRLQQDVEDFLLRVAERPDSFEPGEQSRTVDQFVRRFENLLAADPDYVYTFILYGKFLRRIGELDRANEVFVAANEIDPNIAVVKQQIGNYLAEQGDFVLALRYLMAAVELEPKVAVYHYQIGLLLDHFRDPLLEKTELTQSTLERNLLDAFRQAVVLAPQNRQFRVRYAEAFFDVDRPDWFQALRQWDKLAEAPESDVQAQLIALQRARVLVELDRHDDARAALARVDRPSLASLKAELLARIAAE